MTIRSILRDKIALALAVVRRRGRGASLRVKVAGLLMVVLLVLGVFTIVSVAGRHRSMMTQEFSSKGYAIALSIAASSVETLLFHDASSAQSFLDGYRDIAGVAYIYLQGEGGEMVAHTFIPAVPEKISGLNALPAGSDRSIREIELPGGGRCLDVAVPLLYGVLGQVHVGMDLGIVEAASRRMVLTVIWQFGLAILAGMVFMYVALRHLLRPVKTLLAATERLGAGDLRVRVEAPGTAELDRLAGSFNAMAGHLLEAVKGIEHSRQAGDEATGKLQEVAGGILEGVREEQQNLGLTRGRMEEAETLSMRIRDNLSVLNESVARTQGSAEEILKAIGSMVEGSSQLLYSSESTAGTIADLDSTIRDLSANVEALRGVAAGTASSAAEMDASVRAVESRADEVARITRGVEESFRSGTEAVERSVRSMEGIRLSSERVVELIGRQNNSMASIEEILELIQEINDQTGLLALNAAILSAQAGKHGKGFGVVAGEMKLLSEKTQKSAQQISGLIGTVRGDARETMAAATDAVRTVQESFDLSRRSGEMIGAIRQSVEEVNLRMADIARATREQAAMGGSLGRTARELSDALERMAEATVEQAASSAAILQGAERMKEVARVVNTATDEQSHDTREIDARMKDITLAAEEVRGALEQQRSASRAVMEAVSALGVISGRNRALAEQLGRVIVVLNERAEGLRDETSKFTT